MPKECKTFDLECLMMAKANPMKPAAKLDPLIDEYNPLISILLTSIKTARQKSLKTS
jgi:hypothetical protein